MLKPLNDSLKPQHLFIKYCTVGFYHLSFGFLKRGAEFVIFILYFKVSIQNNEVYGKVTVSHSAAKNSSILSWPGPSVNLDKKLYTYTVLRTLQCSPT